jgi:hypothetical protein
MPEWARPMRLGMTTSQMQASEFAHAQETVEGEQRGDGLCVIPAAGHGDSQDERELP